MKSEKFQPCSAKLDFGSGGFASAIDSEFGLDFKTSHVRTANAGFPALLVSLHSNDV